MTTETGMSLFKFNGYEVSITDKNGEPWFIANDVCAVLGLSNPRKAIQSLDDEDKGVTTGYTPGGPQQVNIINESGMYQLVFQSRKPEAVAFCKWVTKTVLPAIRKTGGYGCHVLDQYWHDLRLIDKTALVVTKNDAALKRQRRLLVFVSISFAQNTSLKLTKKETKEHVRETLGFEYLERELTLSVFGSLTGTPVHSRLAKVLIEDARSTPNWIFANRLVPALLQRDPEACALVDGPAETLELFLQGGVKAGFLSSSNTTKQLKG